MRSRIEPMKKIGRTLRSHRALILNYFRARKQFSSGVVEGLNNKAKLTMRKSYGFRTFHVTETALYHALGKLPEPDVADNFLTRRFFKSLLGCEVGLWVAWSRLQPGQTKLAQPLAHCAFMHPDREPTGDFRL